VTRTRRAALVVGSVAVLGVAGAVALGIVATRRSDRLLAGLSRGLGRDVRARGFGFTLRGGVGVVLSGVEIADDPAFGDAEPFLRADGLDMRLRLLPLVRRRLVVERIDVDGPVVNLVRDRAGHLNVDSLGRREKPAEPGPSGAPHARPAFQLGTLRLRHGTIRYQERATGRVVELTDVAVDARQPRWDAPIPVAVRARLAAGDLRLDGITSDGVVDLAAQRPAYHGSLVAGPGALGSIPVERLTAQVRAVPPAVDLDAATAELLGGTVSGTAHVASEGADAGVTGRLEARDLDLSRLPAENGRPRPAGKLALRGTLVGPPPGGAAFRAGATGEGGFEVADGRIDGAGFGRPALEILQPFLKSGVADRLRTRYPDLFATDDLRFTRLSGSGRLAGGRIRSSDLVLAATSWEARGEGSLGLDGDVDASVRLVGSPALTEDVLGQDPRARVALVDSSGRLTVPLRVRGPVRRPRVTPDPAFAAEVARGVLGRGLGEAAGDVLERLLGGRRKR
jgi:uncharacterized protein involved in outer membrane biogenesis